MDFMKEYRRVSNRLKGLNLDDLLTRITLLLRKHEVSPNDHITKGYPMPWLLLDILKMGVLYAGTNNDVKSVDEKTFAVVYNKLHELDGVY
ncbi:hypothetical protein [uncultured Pseudodesulfovibrio sp.]|uniref:hypothetical protein n=1 Tax=uncultured Pseudodesulfovibrio sp. TaxID=2035858 RepID=UPI0029C63802|nr:hypothetical protein [uncultured Pseudodesulfovibrio sp.]